MGLTLSPKQRQFLSPQMMQSAEILQMGTQELLEHIEKAAQENPVLEIYERYAEQEQNHKLALKWEWLKSNDAQNWSYYGQDFETDTDPLGRYSAAEGQIESLCEHLHSQIELLDLPSEIVGCVQFLSGCLNQNGWLDEDLSSLALEVGQPFELMEQALTVLQTMEPAGVGARNLSECLCLQLLHHRPVEQVAIRIARDHLDELSKNHYGAIARALGEKQSEVRRACDIIRTLNPRPGAIFARHTPLVRVMPDVIVTKTSDCFEILLNDEFLPTLHINSYYTHLMKGSDDKQVKEYLKSKFSQAEWMIRAIEQRKSTLVACAESIVELQTDYFQHGSGHLRPLALTDVAQRMGVHESTVSRAVNGKYLQCATGTFPLSYFFVRRLGSEPENASSADAAKILLNDLISQEDKRKPLSDQKLCQLMAERGCSLSRRTVAKYREEFGIRNASGRKHYHEGRDVR